MHFERSLTVLLLAVVGNTFALKEPKEHHKGSGASSSSSSSSSSSASSSTSSSTSQELPSTNPHRIFNDKGLLVPSRFDYKYSLKHPFHVSDNHTIPFYSLTGGSYVDANRVVKLTEDRANQKGGVWASKPVAYKEWQLTLGFKADGRAIAGGKGLAIWYVEEPKGEGNVYGYKDNWKGLSIMMDSFDNDGKRNNPLIKGFLNDGRSSYMEDRDGEGQTFGACQINYRNSKDPFWVRLTYLGRTLKVEHAHHGSYFDTCFVKNDIDLPTGYYFGVTAQTAGDYADQHEIYLIDVYEINPPEKAERKIPESEIPADSDIWKKFEDLKDHYDGVQDHLEEEEFGHFDKEDLHFVLSHIERNQQFLMEEIQKLSHGDGSSSSGSNGGIGNAVVLNRFDGLDEKIKTLTHHINSLTEVLNQVVERVNGGGSTGGKDNSAVLDKLHDLNSETNRRIASLEDSHARTAKKASDIHDKIQTLTSDPVKTGVPHYTFSTVLWWILGLLLLEIVVYGVYRYIQVTRSNDNSKKFI